MSRWNILSYVIITGSCQFGENMYMTRFGRLPPFNPLIGYMELDGTDGYSGFDVPFYIGDELFENITVYFKPDYCVSWYVARQFKEKQIFCNILANGLCHFISS